MIHLALQVLAFLFLCLVGLVLLVIVFSILGAIGNALGKLLVATPCEPRTQSSKTPFALGHNPIEPNHDPRTCPLCLAAGHPTSGAESEQKCERTGEVSHQQIQYKHIPGLPWGDPSSYVKASTPEELEQAREALNKREAERLNAQSAREREAALEQERKRQADEKRDQETPAFRDTKKAVEGVDVDYFTEQFARVLRNDGPSADLNEVDRLADALDDSLTSSRTPGGRARRADAGMAVFQIVIQIVQQFRDRERFDELNERPSDKRR